MWFLIRLLLFPLRWALKILAPLSLLLVAGLVGYLFFWLPDVALLETNRPETTSFIELTKERYLREGKPGRVRQSWVDLDDIAPAVIEAVLIAEDDRFYLHQGFDYTELMNAMESNLEANRVVRGGSTLSQQLVKNLYLTPSKTYTRKLNEALLTWKLEHSLNKDRILEIYLNVAEWGDGIFGVEEAARYYFKKPASKLNEREAVSLAARLPNPHESGDRPVQRRKARERVILERLQKSQPGFRGANRSLLAENQKNEQGETPGIWNKETLNRVGELAQKQVDQLWEQFSDSEELNWKEPIRVAAPPREVPPIEQDPRNPDTPPKPLRAQPESPTSPVAQVPLALPTPRDDKSTQGPELTKEAQIVDRIEKIQSATLAPAAAEKPPTEAPIGDASPTPESVREKIARLERILSKKN